MSTMNRLKLSAFACFFCGAFFGSLASAHLGVAVVDGISAAGLLIATWQLRFNHDGITR